MAQKPLSEIEYFSQHGDAIGFPAAYDGRAYDLMMRGLQGQLQTSQLMTDLSNKLTDLAKIYAGGRPDLLFYSSKPTEFPVLIKPFQSVKNKIFRINCAWNRDFPSAPKKFPFVSKDNFLEHDKINDLFRTRLVCKYMDGPEFIALGIKEMCDQKNIEFRHYSMSTENGYHSWHCYMKISGEILSGDEVAVRQIWLEIQITTQLTELITGLTHDLYDGARNLSSSRSDTDWKWRPESQQFKATYLGHTLHLLEGIIQTFRDDVLGINPTQSSANSNDHGGKKDERVNTDMMAFETGPAFERTAENGEGGQKS